MQTGTKRLVFGLMMVVGLALFVSSCKKSTSISCKNDADCSRDATGKALNGVCYMGKCEECIEDTDCPDLKQCVKNRCVSACQVDADCGHNFHCEENICVANCIDDSYCFGGKICLNGRCIAEGGVQEGIHSSYNNSDCPGLQRIHFDFDKFEVSESYRAELDKLATCLEANQALTVKIEGHADERGTPSYNMALSERRANAAKEYLVQAKGIASNRIKTLSYGEQKPLLDEKNEYAWQQNRRAEFLLQNAR